MYIRKKKKKKKADKWIENKRLKEFKKTKKRV